MRVKLLLTLALLYFAQDIGLSWQFKRRFSKTASFIGKNAPDSVQKYFGKAVHLTLIYYLLIFIYLITDFDFWGLISNVSILDKTPFQIAGFALAGVFLLLMILTRLNLGSSWREGLDYDTTDDLVTNGFYRFVRNPYFASLMGFQFALILIAPNAIMICSFVQSAVLLGLQTRLEEPFLQQKYGQQYIEYQEKTARFVPKISTK